MASLFPLDAAGEEAQYFFSCSYVEDERNLLLKPYCRDNIHLHLEMKEFFNGSLMNLVVSNSIW